MKNITGVSQVIKKLEEIDDLLRQGYNKTYIYNQLSETGKIRISKKRFYELLIKLNRKNIELEHIYFPGERVEKYEIQTEPKEVTKETRKRKKKNVEVDQNNPVYLQQKQIAIAAFQQHNKKGEDLV